MQAGLSPICWSCGAGDLLREELAVSDVVEANGGSIEVESEEGERSTFAVLLSVKELAS